MAEALAEPAPELTRLLTRLADGNWHSGEGLAREFTCSRAAIAKRVQRLQEGFDLSVEAAAGRGYRLDHRLDLLDRSALRAGLTETFTRLHLPWQIDSTNRWLMDSPAGDDPQCCIAEIQHAGRGRRGRHWQAPLASGLTLSVSAGFDATAHRLGALPLALGVAVARALESEGAAGLFLKWPNDLMVRSASGAAKLGGLLVEARGEMGGSFRVVAGLGLNVHAAPRLDTDTQAACLAEHTADTPSRSRLAAHLARALAEACREFGRKGFPAFADGFAERDGLCGQPITVHAETCWQGIAEGIGIDGALQVRTRDGRLREVHAGDVSVRPAPAAELPAS